LINLQEPKPEQEQPKPCHGKGHLMPSDIRVATDQAMVNAAVRAAEDPLALARCARVIRAALLRGLINSAELSGPIVPPRNGGDGG
jgi:hypothetical protein